VMSEPDFQIDHGEGGGGGLGLHPSAAGGCQMLLTMQTW